MYEYSVRSSRDVQDHHGRTHVFFDGDSGALALLLLSTGQYAGNTFTSWIYALHMGNIFGLPWRIFVCALGLAIVMLSVTGVYIWWKKRSARRRSHRRRTLAEGGASPDFVSNEPSVDGHPSGL